jgi:hypothetical protein
VRHALFAAAALLAACSQKPAPRPESKPTPARITQFYASPAQVARGEKTLLCYGVENAKVVWMAPPRKELSAALSRCVDVTPSETTTYTLTAEGQGAPVTQDVVVTVGAPRAKIVEVRVSSLEIKRGDAVSICYQVSNAKAVRIEPATEPSERPNCGIAHPQRTTTYTVTVSGAGGEPDQERVTIKVH